MGSTRKNIHTRDTFLFHSNKRVMGGGEEKRSRGEKGKKGFLTSRSISSGGRKPFPEYSLDQDRIKTYPPAKQKSTPHTKNIKRKRQTIYPIQNKHLNREGERNREYLHRIEKGFFMECGGRLVWLVVVVWSCVWS